MGIYEKVPYEVGKETSVLQCGRKSDKTVNVRPNLPGNVIVIHGVNDVGTTFQAVEHGLCAGLQDRIGWKYVPGKYRMPVAADKDVLLEDPDAVFFKRQISDETFSPVIPFYWGYREMDKFAGTVRGQNVDRYGNRLDKDLSKGGGTFANATSSLPDMSGRGKSCAAGVLDFFMNDAAHPVLNNPGHLYMILAAKRLAMLIAMIRDYDENEVVTLVAHSQGTMLSLLAQAFLLDDGMRPADTLILNNPPYSLVDDIPIASDIVEGTSGQDERMKNQYFRLEGRQTLHARLQTLVNIVHGVVQKKHSTPPFAGFNDQCVHHGMVSGGWKADTDRDNRGKVYLYFCPEDMTVALDPMQGIGWQGIPDFQRGQQLTDRPEMKRDVETHQLYKTGRMVSVCSSILRHPMKELTALNGQGGGFFQRVFTMKKRPDPATGKPILIGTSSPYDFVLRMKGEDDQSHTAVSEGHISSWLVHSHLPEPVEHKSGSITVEESRRSIRTINGEPLPIPVVASLCEGARADAKGRSGAEEETDPIDAAIAITSNYGMAPDGVWRIYADPTSPGQKPLGYTPRRSPNWRAYDGFVVDAPHKVSQVKAALNKDKPALQLIDVLEVFDCVGINGILPSFDGKVLVHRTESPDDARLRWQHASGARSFHGAIFGGASNHRHVTAYDIAIGGGKAASDPLFYKYLCAVADWRLQIKKGARARPSILWWDNFLAQFAVYWQSEPDWRKGLIKGNAVYYSKGELPLSIPMLDQMPSAVVCETTHGVRFQTQRKVDTSPTPLDERKKAGK